MHNSALINIRMIDTAAKLGVGRYFFSSSVYVYRDMQPGEPEMAEDEAVPANPDNEYGWEKLYAGRLIRTIREEEVDLFEYLDCHDAYHQIGRFLDNVYMHKRIHSSLGYLTSAEFEAQCACSGSRF